MCMMRCGGDCFVPFSASDCFRYIPQGHQEEEWRGAPILTVPPHQTPELPPKWGGTPHSSPPYPLVQAGTQRTE